MSGFVVIAADILVAVLLVATIATSVRLSRRITSLKGDEAAMRTMVGELVAATEKAERAVAGLRAALADGERARGVARQAELQIEQLSAASAAGEAVLDRLEAVAGIGRQIAAGSTPQAAAMPEPARADGGAVRVAMAAAQAIAARAAARAGNRAA